MISPNKTAKVLENLEHDLKRVYDMVYKSFENHYPTTPIPLSERRQFIIGSTEDELFERLVNTLMESNKDMTREEVERETKELDYWKALLRYRKMLLRLKLYFSVSSEANAAVLTTCYAILTHCILFKQLDWDAASDIGADFELSADEIYDGLVNCNHDVVHVILGKLRNCPLADIAYLQDTFEKGQKLDFVGKLNSFSNTDISLLKVFAVLFQVQESFLTLNYDLVKVLLHHTGFRDAINLDTNCFLPKETLDTRINLNEDGLYDDYTGEKMNACSESIDTFLNQIQRCQYAPIKYLLVPALDTIGLFPSERIFIEDALQDPTLKPILDEITVNPFESEVASEHLNPESQPERAPTEVKEPDGDGEKKSRFEWPSWEEFKEKTSIGIPRDFEFLTKLVDGIKNDINPEEDSEVDSKGYERFKRFMNTLADYGSIGDDANMKSLIQFITGKCFAEASSKIRWNADNNLGRVLYFVVQWISDDDEKLGKTARMTDFIYSDPDMPDKGLDMDKISSTLQRAKGIRPDILGRLHDCYAFIPGTKDDAGKRKS